MDQMDKEAKDAYGHAWGAVKKHVNKRTGETRFTAISKNGSVRLFSNEKLAHRHANSEE